MPSIKKNFFYSSILTTANYLFPLLTFPYVSRVLGVTNIGIVNFVDSIIGYFVLFSAMGINIVGIREVAKYRNDKTELSRTFSGLFWLNTLTTSLALILLIVITICVDQLRAYWEMMGIGALKLLMNYMLIEWFYRGLEEFRYITVRTIIVKIIYVVSIFVFVRDQSDYAIYYSFTVMTLVLNAVINLIYSRNYVSLRICNLSFRPFIKPLAYIGVYQILNSMYINLNVMYLGFVSGETEVGYYTTASKLHGILIALYSAFTGVMLPRMSSLLAENKTEEFAVLLKKANNILFTFSIPLVIITIIFAPTIIYIVSGPGYEGAIIPMRLMMPLILIIGYEQILVIQTLMPLKKDRAILMNSIAGASTGLLLNIILIPAMASVGASFVWLTSEIVVLCCAQYFVSKFIQVGFPWSLMFHSLISNIPLMVLLLLIYTQIDNQLISFSLSMIVVCVYFVINNMFISRNDEVCKLVSSSILSLWGRMK